MRSGKLIDGIVWDGKDPAKYADGFKIKAESARKRCRPALPPIATASSLPVSSPERSMARDRLVQDRASCGRTVKPADTIWHHAEGVQSDRNRRTTTAPSAVIRCPDRHEMTARPTFPSVGFSARLTPS